MKRFLLCILPLVLVLVTGVTGAQEALRIAAVVNDEMISAYDLDMRISLVIALSGLPNTLETRRRLAPQALRSLIDDEIKLQEASRLGIPVTENQIERAFAAIEKQNELEKGGLDDFLSSMQVKKSTLARKIEAEISWRKLLNGRFAPILQIGDEEIDEVLAEIEKNKGKPEFLVAEILLPVDKKENEGEVLSLANRLIQQAKSGANFQALAQNFSKSPSAGTGGNIGWTRFGQLGGGLDKALAKLRPGQVSPPVRTVDGFYILLLRDQRTSQGLSGGAAESPVVNLQQFFLPLQKNISPADLAKEMEAAGKLSEKLKSCEELDKVGKDFGSSLSGNLGDIKTSALAQQQRTLVRGLPPLKASPPLRTADGILILMVCKRTEVAKPGMSLAAQRERIANRLIDERLGLAARQHLRDLRRGCPKAMKAKSLASPTG